MNINAQDSCSHAMPFAIRNNMKSKYTVASPGLLSTAYFVGSSHHLLSPMFINLAPRVRLGPSILNVLHIILYV